MASGKTQLRFEYSIIQYLDASGQLTQPLPTAMTIDKLKELYQWLCKTRIFDTKAIALQRTGQLGTYASSLGQEAYSVGIGMSMQTEDCLAPYYRDHAAQLIRGVHEHEILQFWGGSERGSLFKHGPQHDFANCIPIATQITHATGSALAYQLRGEPRVAVASCGDGATSRGDFYESLNYAGLRKLPLVIYVNNNQWAISVPLVQQTACETIAQKALAAQVNSIRVDGNDVIAVYQAMKMSLASARGGEGCTLIEGISYRLCDHTTADDASRYVDADSLRQAWSHCPLRRLKKYLIALGAWSEAAQEELEATYQIHLEDQVEIYLNSPAEEPCALFDHLYAQLPYAYEGQYKRVKLC